MAATAIDPYPLKAVVGDARVIDVDTHYTEPPDLWTSRAPAALKDKVPYMKTIDGQSLWFVEGDRPWGGVGTTVVGVGGQKFRGKLSLASFEEMDRAAYEVKPRLEVMDRMGVWAQIVYPNACGFGATKFLSISDKELQFECVRLYNDAVAEWQKDSGDRLFPQGLLPFWNMEATLKEARRIKEDLHLTGVTLTDRPEVFDLPDYGQPYWEPFFELMNDLQLPLDFHIGSGMKSFVLDDWAWRSLGPQRKLASIATLMYMSNAYMINSFMLSGVLDRYRNLKLVSVESGCGWIPFILEACEYQWEEMAPDEAKELERRPTEYFRDHIYATFWFEDFGVKHFIESIGPNNLLFETDFPHPTCLYPESQAHLAQVLERLEPDVRQRVVQDNALAIYKLPMPA
ncbi:MAG: amidohydrolase family protein [Dehalococcoidia bacterium]